MNAMAALYHIPQNDPPTLAVASWSDSFNSFVELCLRKDANLRPGATQALQVGHLYPHQDNVNANNLVLSTNINLVSQWYQL